MRTPSRKCRGQLGAYRQPIIILLAAPPPGDTILQVPELEAIELKRRLKEGDYLEVKSGGGTYEVWAEPYANPPAVYYEGEPFPITELDEICRKLLEARGNGEVSLRWADKD